MTGPEILRLIKTQVRSELCQSLGGTIIKTDDSFTCSLRRFAGDSPLNSVRMIRPYGLASRPSPATPTVVHPINGDPTHLIALGEYDSNRPEVEPGETALYGSSGQLIYTQGTDILISDYSPSTGAILPVGRASFHEDGAYELGTLKSVSSNALGEVFIGSPQANSPMVLGDILAQFCDQLITALSSALTAIQSGPIATIGPTVNPGDPATTAPGVASAMASALSALTELQATFVDSSSTNFNSNSNFTQKEAP